MTLNKRCIILNFLLLIMLGGSVFFNTLLYGQARKYYLELNQTRLDPLGLNDYPVNSKDIADQQANTPTNNHQIRVVFFGDSRAAGWVTPRVTPRVTPKINGYTFINRGIIAQTSTQVSQRFTHHVSPLQPNIVIIQVGINDLKTVALFPERRNAIVATCKDNIKHLIEASRKLGAVVIVTTIFPVGDVPLERRPFWSDEIGQAVNEVNAYIATLANEKTIVFDTFSILANREGMMVHEYSNDELHINDEGYRVLNQALVRLLNAIKP